MIKRELCNACGVSESEIHDGVCRYCPGEGTYCRMSESDFIEKRVYDFARKHNLLTFMKRPTFIPENIRERFENPAERKGVPKYFLNAISCDGLTFDCLAAFPVCAVLRVCRGSSDSSFLQVGDLVCRSQRDSGTDMDGLILIRGGGAWDRNESESALKGACFEPTYHTYMGT